MTAILQLPLAGDVYVDMCTQGLKDPETGDLMKKKTRLRTNSRTIRDEFLVARCGLHHGVGEDIYPPHQTVHRRTGQDGKRVHRSTVAGHYTELFAKNLLKAARDELVQGYLGYFPPKSFPRGMLRLRRPRSPLSRSATMRCTRRSCGRISVK